MAADTPKDGASAGDLVIGAVVLLSCVLPLFLVLFLWFTVALFWLVGPIGSYLLTENLASGRQGHGGESSDTRQVSGWSLVLTWGVGAGVWLLMLIWAPQEIDPFEVDQTWALLGLSGALVLVGAGVGARSGRGRRALVAAEVLAAEAARVALLEQAEREARQEQEARERQLEQARRAAAAAAALKREVQRLLRDEAAVEAGAPDWSREDRSGRAYALLSLVERRAGGQVTTKPAAGLAEALGWTEGELAFFAGLLAVRELVQFTPRFSTDQIGRMGLRPVFAAGAGVAEVRLTRDGVAYLDREPSARQVTVLGDVKDSTIVAGDRNRTTHHQDRPPPAP